MDAARDPALVPVPNRGEVRMVPLEGRAAELAAAIGIPDTLAVLTRFGGQPLDLPTDADGSALAGLIGVPATRALIAAFGPGPVQLPMPELRGGTGRRSRGMWLLMDGQSHRDVAFECDVTTRTVENWARTLRLSGLAPQPDPAERGNG